MIATAVEKTCILKTAGYAINERVAPSINAKLTDYSPISPASTVKIYEFAEADGFLWAKTVYGWFVVRSMDNGEWWSYGVEGASEVCVDIPGWPGGLIPPVPIAANIGVWVGPGADISELIEFGNQLYAAGYKPAATVYGANEHAKTLYLAGWTIALRPWIGDCPELYGDPVASANKWVDKAISAIGDTPYNWLVLSNECAWPSAEWLKAWIDTAVNKAAEWGVKAIVPVVFNPGAPELDWVATVAQAYRDSPMPACWGMNLYPAKQGVSLSQRDDWTQWTTFRYELYRNTLDGIPMCVTEAARSDGSEAPDFDDIARFVKAYSDDFEWLTLWYDAMPLGHWPDATLRGKLSQLTEALK